MGEAVGPGWGKPQKEEIREDFIRAVKKAAMVAIERLEKLAQQHNDELDEDNWRPEVIDTLSFSFSASLNAKEEEKENVLFRRF